VPTTRKKQSGATISPSQLSDDNLHPQLYDRLTAWRSQKGVELKKPLYTIMTSRALLAIANYLPLSMGDMQRLPGIGKKNSHAYGAEIIAIVEDFITSQDPDKLVTLPFPK
jgi:ribonuclease D